MNYLAQKYLTGSQPPSREELEQKRNHALQFHGIYEKYASRPITDSVAYEIGSGWILGMALSLSGFGYKRIICSDLHEHVRMELINGALAHLKDMGAVPPDLPFVEKREFIGEFLRENFSISLLAPFNSAKTGFADGSIDFIFSYAVFEHIPETTLYSIMQESRRVMTDVGIAQFHVDYQDHYAGFDANITPYNFYKYSNSAWRKYNTRVHYVNRLRHSDFRRIFTDTGFEIIEETVFRPDNWREMLKRISLAPEFNAYDLDDLSYTAAHFVLRKAAK